MDAGLAYVHRDRLRLKTRLNIHYMESNGQLLRAGHYYGVIGRCDRSMGKRCSLRAFETVSLPARPNGQRCILASKEGLWKAREKGSERKRQRIEGKEDERNKD